jgi:hypothetical protein
VAHDQVTPTTTPTTVKRGAGIDRADAVVLVGALAAAGLLLWLGLGLTFFADEWGVINEREISVQDFFRPFNEHWLGVTILVYRLELAVAGLHSYVPYHALLVALHVTVALCVYVLVRRRTHRAVAVGIALVTLVFGSGFENLYWGVQIGFVGATALGFGALLLLDDVPTLPGTRRAIAATALLTVGVMTSGYGLFMLALAGFDLLLDARRRRWVLLLLAPAVVYGTWYLVLGRSGVGTYGNPFTPERIAAVIPFVVDGVAAAIGAATGLGPLAGPWLVVVLIAWIAWLAVTHRPVPSRAIACLLAIVAQYAIVGLVRVQLGIDAATFTRYTYLSGMLAMIAIASLVGRPSLDGRRRTLAMGAGLLVLLMALGWNLQLLVAGRSLYADRAELTRALVMLGTTDPLPAGVEPGRSLVLVPSPDRLREILANCGSPLADVIAPGSVAPVSDAARDEALDRAQHPPAWLLEMEAQP